MHTLKESVSFSKKVLSVIVITTLSTAALAQEQVTITTGEWAPYISNELPHKGFLTQIINQAFALQNIKVEWGFFPWSRAMLYAKNGKWDASAIWSYSNERAQHFIYSDPILQHNNVFFHLKSNPFNWSSFSDLKDLRLGATSGYFYGEEFDQAINKNTFQVQRVPIEALNFKKLLRKKIDVFPANLHVGYALLKKILPADKASEITHHEKPFNSKGLYLLFSKKSSKSKSLTKSFNLGLQQLKASGKLDAIIKQHLNHQND